MRLESGASYPNHFGDTIIFATNGTIPLTSGELVIRTNLNIIGPGAMNLAVSGSGLSRVFNIPAGVTSSISGLTIRDGQTTNGTSPATIGSHGGTGGAGGGVYNLGMLVLNDCVVSANRTGAGGNGTNGMDGLGTSFPWFPEPGGAE